MKHADLKNPVKVSGTEFSAPTASANTVEDAEREREVHIATRAYFLSESRAFEPGHEVEDWLAAEVEVDAIALPRPATR